MYFDGKKIRLRRFREHDLPVVKKWLNDREIQWFTDEDFPMRWTDEMIQQFYGKAIKGKKEMYAIETFMGLLVGEIWLTPISLEHRYGEMVITIDRPYQGQGFGRDAIQVILRYGFIHLDLHRIEIKVYSFNERALHLYRSCGFKEEGRLRERIQRNGEYYDQIFMSILKEEYFLLRERSRQI